MSGSRNRNWAGVHHQSISPAHPPLKRFPIGRRRSSIGVVVHLFFFFKPSKWCSLFTAESIHVRRRHTRTATYPVFSVITDNPDRHCGLPAGRRAYRRRRRRRARHLGLVGRPATQPAGRRLPNAGRLKRMDGRTGGRWLRLSVHKSAEAYIDIISSLSRHEICCRMLNNVSNLRRARMHARTADAQTLASLGPIDEIQPSDSYSAVVIMMTSSSRSMTA